MPSHSHQVMKSSLEEETVATRPSEHLVLLGQEPRGDRSLCYHGWDTLKNIPQASGPPLPHLASQPLGPLKVGQVCYVLGTADQAMESAGKMNATKGSMNIPPCSNKHQGFEKQPGTGPSVCGTLSDSSSHTPREPSLGLDLDLMSMPCSPPCFLQRTLAATAGTGRT